MKTKNFLSLLLVFSIFLSSLPFQVQAASLDSASGWAKAGIEDAVSKGFVPQSLQSAYTQSITRQEFAQLAVSWVSYALGKPIDTILKERYLSLNQAAFNDTQDPAILAAYALNIISGTTAPTSTTKGVFSPNQTLTREQAAVMLFNTAKVIGMNVSNDASASFSDINTASAWAQDAINFCYNAKIMTGTNANPLTFSPKAQYTREQSIITFNNIGNIIYIPPRQG